MLETTDGAKLSLSRAVPLLRTGFLRPRRFRCELERSTVHGPFALVYVAIYCLIPCVDISHAIKALEALHSTIWFCYGTNQRVLRLCARAVTLGLLEHTF